MSNDILTIVGVFAFLAGVACIIYSFGCVHYDKKSNKETKERN